MILTLSLGLLVLVHGAWSTSPPGQILQTRPLLLKPSCNDSRVLSVAGLALEKINEDRKEGYIFRLNRVADVREHHQAGSGSVYYLTLDVVDTNCHVLSKKNWKDCEIGQFFESVYGQCKAIFYVNLPRRILDLPAYNCTIRPVSRRELVTLCPDCPVYIANFSDPRIFQTVSESLEKINKETTVGKKFHLFKVTKVLTYWVTGPAYSVEFLVTESPCTKSLPKKCLPPPANAQPVGICKGSLSGDHIKKYVSGTCEFFQSQPTSAPESHPPEHQVSQQLASSTDAPPLEEPKGSVQLLPDPSVGKFEDFQEKKPIVTFPVHVSLTTEPLGEVLHLPSHYLLEKEELPIVLPFPEGLRSNECPGPAEYPNSLILPP